MEWKIVWKEILFGFTVAGFVAVFVPDAFWDRLFIGSSGGSPAEAGATDLSLLLVLENAAVTPIVAFCTFIGSMGNVPLAAMLCSKGNSFVGVMSFLGADLVRLLSSGSMPNSTAGAMPPIIRRCCCTCAWSPPA